MHWYYETHSMSRQLTHHDDGNELTHCTIETISASVMREANTLDEAKPLPWTQRNWSYTLTIRWVSLTWDGSILANPSFFSTFFSPSDSPFSLSKPFFLLSCTTHRVLVTMVVGFILVLGEITHSSTVDSSWYAKHSTGSTTKRANLCTFSPHHFIPSFQLSQPEIKNHM